MMTFDDRHGLLELHVLAQERGDGLIPGFHDLLCRSLCEGLPGGNVVDLSVRLHERLYRDDAKRKSTD